MLYRVFFALLLLTQLPAAAARELTGAEIRQLKDIAVSAEAADLNAYMQALLEAGVSLESLISALVANAADLGDVGLAGADAASLAAFLQGLASPAQLAVAMMAAGYPANEAVLAVAEATATPLETLIADSRVAAAMAASDRAAADSARAAPAPTPFLRDAVSPGAGDGGDGVGAPTPFLRDAVSPS